MSPQPVDVAVIGTGPCGLGLAAACARRGLSVRCIGPQPDAPWIPNFGIWEDDAQALGLLPFLSHRWADARVSHADGSLRPTGRGYARLDNRALQAHWQQELGGRNLVRGLVEDVRAVPGASELLLADGRRITAEVVFRATGAKQGPASPGGDPAFQTAYGITARLRQPWPDDGQMWLMDFRHRFDDQGPPGFLYVMPLGDGLVFLEETVLAARPAVSFDVLKRRLAERLAALGIGVDEVVDEEFCWIPMGASPASEPAAIAFGAAAGLVHPATGYLLGHTLRIADEVAAALAATPAGAGQGATGERYRAAHHAIWSPDRQRVWALYQFGLEVLLQLDADGLQAFFDRFFDLPPADWADFLSARASAAGLAGTMMTFFQAAPFSLQRRLAGAALGQHGRALAGRWLRAH